MPPKQNSNKWSDLQLAIAAMAMTSVLALWNMFAGPDREKAENKVAENISPTPTIEVAPSPVVEAPTMPPLGYTILFGGQAPKKQVITVQSGGGGGGGGGNNSAPVTSTSSS